MGWGDLIQIAAPDKSSNAAKQEKDMSEVTTTQTATDHAVECVLAATDSYLETLSLKTVAIQPGLLELVVRTQLLSAKNPAEKRVKSRTCIERSRLVELQQAVDQILQATRASFGEPLGGEINGPV